MASKQKRALYRITAKKSFCRGKRIVPNKCEKITHCKVASGKTRRYCRKRRATRYTKRN